MTVGHRAGPSPADATGVAPRAPDVEPTPVRSTVGWAVGSSSESSSPSSPGIVLRFWTTSDLWLDEALTANIAGHGLGGPGRRCCKSRRRPAALLRAAPRLDAGLRHRATWRSGRSRGCSASPSLALCWPAGRAPRRRVPCPPAVDRGGGARVRRRRPPTRSGTPPRTACTCSRCVLVLLGYLALWRALERPRLPAAGGRRGWSPRRCCTRSTGRSTSSRVTGACLAWVAWHSSEPTRAAARRTLLARRASGASPSSPGSRPSCTRRRTRERPGATPTVPPSGLSLTLDRLRGRRPLRRRPGEARALPARAARALRARGQPAPHRPRPAHPTWRALGVVVGWAVDAHRSDSSRRTSPATRSRAGTQRSCTRCSCSRSRTAITVFASRRVRYGIIAFVVVFGFSGAVRNVSESRTQGGEVAAAVNARAAAPATSSRTAPTRSRPAASRLHHGRRAAGGVPRVPSSRSRRLGRLRGRGTGRPTRPRSRADLVARAGADRSDLLRVLRRVPNARRQVRAGRPGARTAATDLRDPRRRRRGDLRAREPPALRAVTAGPGTGSRVRSEARAASGARGGDTRLAARVGAVARRARRGRRGLRDVLDGSSTTTARACAPRRSSQGCSPTTPTSTGRSPSTATSAPAGACASSPSSRSLARASGWLFGGRDRRRAARRRQRLRVRVPRRARAAHPPRDRGRTRRDRATVWLGAVAPPAGRVGARLRRGHLPPPHGRHVPLPARAVGPPGRRSLGFLAGLLPPVRCLPRAPAVIEVAPRVARERRPAARARGVAAVAAPVAGVGTYLAWVGARVRGLRCGRCASSRRRTSAASFRRSGLGAGRHGRERLRTARRGLVHVVAWRSRCVALLVVVVRRLPASYAAFAGISLLLALSAENLDSFERYALGAFPLLIGAGLCLRVRGSMRLVVVLSSVGLFATSTAVFLGRWVPVDGPGCGVAPGRREPGVRIPGSDCSRPVDRHAVARSGTEQRGSVMANGGTRRGDEGNTGRPARGRHHRRRAGRVSPPRTS